MNKKKTPLASKTVWLGLLTSVVSVVAANVPALGDILNEHWASVGVFLGAIIIVLRGLTDRPLRIL